MSEAITEIFKQGLQARVDGMRKAVEDVMVNDGDTEETSQRICMLNALNNLEATISGIEYEDLIFSTVEDE